MGGGIISGHKWPEGIRALDLAFDLNTRCGCSSCPTASLLSMITAYVIALELHAVLKKNFFARGLSINRQQVSGQ